MTRQDVRWWLSQGGGVAKVICSPDGACSRGSCSELTCGQSPAAGELTTDSYSAEDVLGLRSCSEPLFNIHPERSDTKLATLSLSRHILNQKCVYCHLLVVGSHFPRFVQIIEMLIMWMWQQTNRLMDTGTCEVVFKLKQVRELDPWHVDQDRFTFTQLTEYGHMCPTSKWGLSDRVSGKSVQMLTPALNGVTNTSYFPNCSFIYILEPIEAQCVHFCECFKPWNRVLPACSSAAWNLHHLSHGPVLPL